MLKPADATDVLLAEITAAIAEHFWLFTIRSLWFYLSQSPETIAALVSVSWLITRYFRNLIALKMNKIHLLAIFLTVIVVAAQGAHQRNEKEKPQKEEKREIKEKSEKAKDGKATKPKHADHKHSDKHSHEKRLTANETQHDRCGGPSFLANATNEVRANFKKIFEDRTLNNTAKELAIAALIAKQSVDLQDTYSKFQAERAAKIAALSPKAKEAYDSIQQIMNDGNLDERTKKTKVKAIKKGVSVTERQELKDLKHHYKQHKKCDHKDKSHKYPRDGAKDQHAPHSSVEGSSEEI
uniref:DUF148 domain-containing protein n=1 Tax=Plectus sambesii TaxID=2011161 RepID=A0A914X3K2_9BILA